LVDFARDLLISGFFLPANVRVDCDGGPVAHVLLIPLALMQASPKKPIMKGPYSRYIFVAFVSWRTAYRLQKHPIIGPR